jgi:hypothetical protein
MKLGWPIVRTRVSASKHQRGPRHARASRSATVTAAGGERGQRDEHPGRSVMSAAIGAMNVQSTSAMALTGDVARLWTVASTPNAKLWSRPGVTCATRTSAPHPPAADAPGGCSAPPYGLRSTAAQPDARGGSLFNRRTWSTFRQHLCSFAAPCRRVGIGGVGRREAEPVGRSAVAAGAMASGALSRVWAAAG